MEARYACPTCPLLCVRGFAFDERIEFEEKHQERVRIRDRARVIAMGLIRCAMSL